MKKDVTNEAVLQSEAKIQQDCVLWYRNNFCLVHHNPRCMIFSIPNEGRGAASAQLIATGLYPGCADLVIFHSRNNRENEYGSPKGLPVFIEVKRDDGVQSENQMKFEEHAKECYVTYRIVRSLDEFKRVVENL
jgi:hypothetical protein